MPPWESVVSIILAVSVCMLLKLQNCKFLPLWHLKCIHQLVCFPYSAKGCVCFRQPWISGENSHFSPPCQANKNTTDQNMTQNNTGMLCSKTVRLCHDFLSKHVLCHDKDHSRFIWLAKSVWVSDKETPDFSSLKLMNIICALMARFKLINKCVCFLL